MLFRTRLGLFIAAILLATNIAFAAIYKQDVTVHNDIHRSENHWKVICTDSDPADLPLSIAGLDEAYKLALENCGIGNFSLIDHRGNDRVD